MNRTDALAALAAANIPNQDAEAQLFTIERVLSRLGTSFEQHVDLLRNSANLEVRVDYLSGLFGHEAARAAHVLFTAVEHQDRPVPPAVWPAESNAPVTHPVSSAVQRALDDFDARHLYERDAVLAPYGLTSHHIAHPGYREVEVATAATPPDPYSRKLHPVEQTYVDRKKHNAAS
ncbi:hypothetical protein HUN59_14745 [Curtobacterium sp. Csp2]|uniref:hypothetical protein n=1 Tax=Curtobacterium sp. Csp2 TaxID=2495430 RepID=UPI00157FE611|nr:hypothetical protein [Curtobacterium sp. Csp2]QKS17299.1 hypothetical protein HUN59_14745 [Curtobacterium sp. Csp2]